MPETIKRMFRPGGAIYALIGLVALAVISGGIVVSVPSFRGAAGREMEPLSELELAVTLTRVGLDAGPLVAAGLTTPKVQAVVAAARGHLEGSIQGLRDADEDYAAAKNSVDHLERVVRSGLATQQQKEAYTTAKTQLASAAAERQAALDTVFAEAAEGLTVGQLAVVNAIKSGRAGGWSLPTQYLAVGRDEKDWVALRDALANQDIAARLGQSPNPAAQQLILTENAAPAVASAKTNLDANLTTLTATWNQSVYP